MKRELYTLVFNDLFNYQSHMAKHSQFLSLQTVQVNTIMMRHIFILKRQRQHVLIVRMMMTFRTLTKQLYL